MNISSGSRKSMRQARRTENMPIQTKLLSYDDYVHGIQQLKPEELVSLLEIISANLKKTLKEKNIKHSIMELEGLGAEIWEGIDAQEYVRQERATWD
jgi:hypothetical protein